MERGKICIYGGSGQGKTSAALGKALQAAARGKQAVIIQFMKGREPAEERYLKRLEPELKFFCFEKSEKDFVDLPRERQREEAQNIKNGLNYARKVLHTGECDLLVLDEVLGLLEQNIITKADLEGVLRAKTEEVTLIMTGRELREDICLLADEVSRIETVNGTERKIPAYREN